MFCVSDRFCGIRKPKTKFLLTALSWNIVLLFKFYKIASFLVNKWKYIDADFYLCEFYPQDCTHVCKYTDIYAQLNSLNTFKSIKHLNKHIHLGMYMCTFIFDFQCHEVFFTCIFLCIYIYICIFLPACKYIHIHYYMYVSVHIHPHLTIILNAKTCVWVYVYMYI